eukprot:7380073-Prymnesium_polylepis.1
MAQRQVREDEITTAVILAERLEVRTQVVRTQRWQVQRFCLLRRIGLNGSRRLGDGVGSLLERPKIGLVHGRLLVAVLALHLSVVEVESVQNSALRRAVAVHAARVQLLAHAHANLGVGRIECVADARRNGGKPEGHRGAAVYMY